MGIITDTVHPWVDLPCVTLKRSIPGTTLRCFLTGAMPVPSGNADEGNRKLAWSASAGIAVAASAMTVNPMTMRRDMYISPVSDLTSVHYRVEIYVPRGAKHAKRPKKVLFPMQDHTKKVELA
ncbi:hypothetical protein [Streptosporangium subroseum]|uniref:hypothetical protein n=1 Tax=Streptosporangium subroseum TaxID=106412 RepID=UPI0030883620|nr:hypothetical protein OHB15_37440 [Streptosporangium subroseum]